MTNLDKIKNLAGKCGADTSHCKTNIDALNCLSEALGGKTGAVRIAEAIDNITEVAGGGKVDWKDSTLTFSNKTGLTGVSIPDGVTSIYGYTFNDCTSLSSVTIPESVESIEYFAFGNCAALDEIVVPAKRLGSQVFKGCTGLTKVDLPYIQSFGSNCFSGCTKLATVIVRNNAVPSVISDSLAGTAVASGTGYIYVPKASIDSYKTTSHWKTYAARFRAIEDYPDICG